MAKTSRADIVQAETGWQATCHGPGCAPFVTSGWSTRKQAETRIAEHHVEHDDGTPMTEMVEFCGVHAPELLPK